MSRNKQIDGLKGILAVIIVVYHVVCRYQQIYLDSSIEFMERWGTLSVCSFFVISGYYLLPQTAKGGYFKHKILRLWPLYAVSLTITTVVIYILALPNNNVSVLNYILNLFCINGFIGTPYIEGAHWYMTAMLSFVLLCSVLILVRQHDNPMCWIAIIILNCATAYVGVPILQTLLGGGYIGIACCGMAAKRYGLEDNLKIKLMWLALGVISIAFTWKFRGIDSVIGIGIGVTFLELTVHRKIPFLECRLFQFLGYVSFALYLVHQNVAYAIQNVLTVILGSFNYGFCVISIASVVLLSVILVKVENKMNHRLCC